jgi:hypothetical protein
MNRPLCEILLDPIQKDAVDRMWRGIRARRASPRRPALVLLAAAAAAVLLALGGWQLEKALAPRALLTDEGQIFRRLVAAPEASARQLFADGSTIEAAPGARLQGLASTPQEFSVLLEEGTVDFSVNPGGPRRWVVEAKVARVEVAGTRFRVTRHGDEVRVAVAEGVVAVRSIWLAQGVQRLSAGEEVVVKPPPARATPVLAPSPWPLPSAVSRRVQSAARESAADLMRQADAARLARNSVRAEQLLDRLVREYPGSSQSPLAAYTLGVVRLQRARAPQAIEALRLAIALGAPATLQQDCYLRLVEAELASGRRRRAQLASEEYRRHFPTGRHRRAIAQLLESQERP